MTRAEIEVRGKVARVRLAGHAGDRLVCAGISAMSCAVLNALGPLARDVVYESGEVRFAAMLDDERARGALDVLICGLTQLQKKFPDRVGVSLVGEDVLK